jgi:membrane associated rhomboid family serine protease
MRLIAKLDSKEKAKRFSAYLEQEDCPALIEHESDGFSVWIYDEDHLQKANELYQKFIHPEFNVEIKEDVKEKPVETGPIPLSDDPIFLAQMQEIRKKMLAKAMYRTFHAKITQSFIFICSVFLMVNIFYYASYSSNPDKLKMPTPLMEALFYDAPFIPQEKQYEKNWPGYFMILENYDQMKPLLSAPKFTKILKGEFWRLFTPALLHGGILHLVFNMVWLWVLGKHIEERLRKQRYLVLILVLGIFSNTMQYLMTGANFMGFSGVICGFAGFIWARQKLTPWEGYPIPKSTLNFLFVFIFGVALVQLIAFIITYFKIVDLTLNIANAAHLSGLLLGAFLGRIHYFDRQKK